MAATCGLLFFGLPCTTFLHGPSRSQGPARRTAPWGRAHTFGGAPSIGRPSTRGRFCRVNGPPGSRWSTPGTSSRLSWAGIHRRSTRRSKPDAARCAHRPRSPLEAAPWMRHRATGRDAPRLLGDQGPCASTRPSVQRPVHRPSHRPHALRRTGVVAVGDEPPTQAPPTDADLSMPPLPGGSSPPRPARARRATGEAPPTPAPRCSVRACAARGRLSAATAASTRRRAPPARGAARTDGPREPQPRGTGQPGCGGRSRRSAVRNARKHCPARPDRNSAARTRRPPGHASARPGGRRGARTGYLSLPPLSLSLSPPEPMDS